MTSVFDTLQERGFVAQCSDEGLRQLLAEERFSVYVGFDPTGASLQLGNLVPLMGLKHLQRAGHRVLLVVGGATGMVGDPSGRSEERTLLSTEQVAANGASFKRQMRAFLDFEGANPAVMLDNADWIAPMRFVDWLREVGKYFTVNYMLAKESVKERLESASGISFTEFSYMTMQAYDFLHLYDAYGCKLQCGGSDQWGNITAGIELIRKLRQGSAYGLTFPLLTTSTGEKFGKSAGNALYIDPDKTSPWELYQFFVRQDDRDVVRFLKLFTLLPLDRIIELERATVERPEQREAQKALGFEVTGIVHGEQTAKEIVRAAETIYYSEIRDLSDATLAAVFADVPSSEIAIAELEQGVELPSVLVSTGLTASKGEARRLLASGGVYVNNVRAAADRKLTLADRASQSFVVLRTGRKSYHLLRVVAEV